MPFPFYDTSDHPAGKDLFDDTGRAGNGPGGAPGGGGPDLSKGVPGAPPSTSGWGGVGTGATANGGLDLSDTRRISTQYNTNGPEYGKTNNETIGQYEGGANDLASHYSQQGAAAQGRAGEQINNPYAYQDRNNNDYAQGQQRAALGNLADAAAGVAPSQASIQMQQGLQQSLAGQMAAANSVRGGGAGMALAQRNAAAQGSAMQGNVMGQQAALRAQEMAQARSAYMQGSNDLRGSNQGAYGMDQQSAFQQAGLNAAQRAQNDSYQQGYEGMGLNTLQSQLSADTSKYGADRGVAIANSQQAASNVNAGIGATAATIGAIGMMASDMRLKTDVSTDGPAARTKQVLPGELGLAARSGSRGQVTQFASDERLKDGGPGARAASEADAFLASLHPSSYRYKDAANEPGMGSGGGRYLGIMAQDVERGPTGDTIVKDTPAGKAIDVKPMVSGLAAGVGRLHERLRELEAERAASKGKK